MQVALVLLLLLLLPRSVQHRLECLRHSAVLLAAQCFNGTLQHATAAGMCRCAGMLPRSAKLVKRPPVPKEYRNWRSASTSLSSPSTVAATPRCHPSGRYEKFKAVRPADAPVELRCRICCCSQLHTAADLPLVKLLGYAEHAAACCAMSCLKGLFLCAVGCRSSAGFACTAQSSHGASLSCIEGNLWWTPHVVSRQWQAAWLHLPIAAVPHSMGHARCARSGSRDHLPHVMVLQLHSG